MKKKGKNKKRPYYAKWWFFLGILTLGWLTPITKYWEIFFFGKETTAYALRMPTSFGVLSWQYIYIVNGRQYIANYDGGFVLSKFPEVNNIDVLYNIDRPDENFVFQLSSLYKDEHLFFPVALQIFMGVFFLSLRLRNI